MVAFASTSVLIALTDGSQVNDTDIPSNTIISLNTPQVWPALGWNSMVTPALISVWVAGATFSVTLRMPMSSRAGNSSGI